MPTEIESVGPYYGAILEHPFLVIEHTLGQVPLADSTLDSMRAVYDARRTEHYYGTTVTTEAQARYMRDVAVAIHEHIVTFDHEIEEFCRC